MTLKIWRDKKGKWIDAKEFFSRLKEGISETTALQKTKLQIGGTRIMLIGITLGLIMSLIAYKQMWWVAIILLGALINTGVQYLGLIQQRMAYEEVDKAIKIAEEESKKEEDKQVVNEIIGRPKNERR